jgi:hypothetical protein
MQHTEKRLKKPVLGAFSASEGLPSALNSLKKAFREQTHQAIRRTK